MILKGEIDPDSVQDREERRHMRSSVFAVLTRKDSFDRTTVRRGGADSTAHSPSQSIMLMNKPKSNSFTGGVTSSSVPDLRTSPTGAGTGTGAVAGSGNGVISSAVNSARAALGSRSNSFNAFVSLSLNALSDKEKLDESKKNSEKAKEQEVAATVTATVTVASSAKTPTSSFGSGGGEEKEKEKEMETTKVIDEVNDKGQG